MKDNKDKFKEKLEKFYAVAGILAFFIIIIQAVIDANEEEAYKNSICHTIGCNIEREPGSVYCIIHKFEHENPSYFKNKNTSSSSSSTNKTSSSSSNSTNTVNKKPSSNKTYNHLNNDPDDYDSPDDYADDAWGDDFDDWDDAYDYWEDYN